MSNPPDKPDNMPDFDMFRKQLGEKEVSKMYFKIYALSEELKKIKKISEREEELRKENPGLQNAWETYQLMLQLLKNKK